MNVLPLYWLLVGHVLADYPLQGDFLARAKNHLDPVPGVPWWQALTAHALIQSAVVLYVLHSWPLALAEFCLHWVIDYGKSERLYGYNADQLLHVLCKVIWWQLALLSF